MQDFMRNIVNSEVVQELLEEVREEQMVTPAKYEEICTLIQERINSKLEVLLLDPYEVAALVEEAIMIYSTKKNGTNFHVLSTEKSVDLAFSKLVESDNKEQTLM